MTDRFERLVVLANHNSTRARKVAQNVLARLDDAGVRHETVTTRSANTSDNIADLSATIRPGDTWISAAGDGTAMALVNATLRQEPKTAASVKLGFLGYGNFNDVAGSQRDPLELLADNAQTQPLHPMTIEVNGKLWRYSPAYLTLGATARLAAGFGQDTSREQLKESSEHTKLLRSLVQLGRDYFDVRSEYLPAFHASHSLTVRNAVTDVLFINSPRVGRIIRSTTDYAQQPTFGYRESNVASIARNIPFGIAALAGFTPATAMTGQRLTWDRPANLPAQTEGEFESLEDVTDLFVYKDPQTVLKMLKAA